MSIIGCLPVIACDLSVAGCVYCQKHSHIRLLPCADHCCSPLPPDSANLLHIGANVVCLRARERENLAVHLLRGGLKIWSEGLRRHTTTLLHYVPVTLG